MSFKFLRTNTNFIKQNHLQNTELFTKSRHFFQKYSKNQRLYKKLICLKKSVFLQKYKFYIN